MPSATSQHVVLSRGHNTALPILEEGHEITLCEAALGPALQTFDQRDCLKLSDQSGIWAEPDIETHCGPPLSAEPTKSSSSTKINLGNPVHETVPAVPESKTFSSITLPRLSWTLALCKLLFVAGVAVHLTSEMLFTVSCLDRPDASANSHAEASVIETISQPLVRDDRISVRDTVDRMLGWRG